MILFVDETQAKKKTLQSIIKTKNGYIYDPLQENIIIGYRFRSWLRALTCIFSYTA